jgi:hypothetical protein
LHTLSFLGTKTPCGVELKVQLGRQAVVLYIGQMETKRGVSTIRVSTTAEQRLMPDNLSNDFIRFAIAEGVLCFGEFKTKAGRLSPVLKRWVIQSRRGTAPGGSILCAGDSGG